MRAVLSFIACATLAHTAQPLFDADVTGAPLGKQAPQALVDESAAQQLLDAHASTSASRSLSASYPPTYPSTPSPPVLTSPADEPPAETERDVQTSIFLSDAESFVNDLRSSIPFTKYRDTNPIQRKLASHTAVHTYAEQVLVSIISASGNGYIRQGTMIEAEASGSGSDGRVDLTMRFLFEEDLAQSKINDDLNHAISTSGLEREVALETLRQFDGNRYGVTEAQAAIECENCEDSAGATRVWPFTLALTAALCLGLS